MKRAICIFLVVGTLAVYAQVLDHDFINFDDPQYVTENLHVKSGLTSESVKWAFTTSSFSNWFPMTWLSHMLDYRLYGSNPKGHHLTNLFFHIVNTLLLFTVLRLMTGATWQSGFVAALFALHPINVESVAWVAERKNVLSTFFWFLTMWAYVYYVEKPHVKRYGLVVLLFTLGLMSKPMLVTLPFILLMMDYWPLRRVKFEQERDAEEIKGENSVKRLEIWRVVREKIPLFIIAAGSGIVTFIVQKSGGAVQGMEGLSLSARLTNAMVSYLEYLKKTLWPEDLAVFYPHPGNALDVWKGILCSMLLVGITAVTIKLVKKAPYLAFGWFWYLGTLVPVIGIVQVGAQAMADRYAYIPLIGIFIIVAWSFPKLVENFQYKNMALFISGGILISGLMIITWIQVSYWKNSITLYKHAISVTDKVYPLFAKVHINLGTAHQDKGNFDEAIAQYKIAIKIRPDYSKAYYNLGLISDQKGEKREAIDYYRKAISLKPDLAPSHYNLGNLLFQEEKLEEAINHYKAAIRIAPGHYLAHSSLGNALVEKGEMQEALKHYIEIKKLKPDFLPSRKHLDRAILGAKKVEEAKTTPLPLP